MHSCEAPYCGGWTDHLVKVYREEMNVRRSGETWTLSAPTPHPRRSSLCFKNRFLCKSVFMPTCACAITLGLTSVQQSVLQEEEREGGRFAVIYLMKKHVYRRKSNSLSNSLIPLYLSIIGCIISLDPTPIPWPMDSHTFLKVKLIKHILFSLVLHFVLL